jgi:hypothetical protein
VRWFRHTVACYAPSLYPRSTLLEVRPNSYLCGPVRKSAASQRAAPIAPLAPPLRGRARDARCRAGGWRHAAPGLAAPPRAAPLLPGAPLARRAACGRGRRRGCGQRLGCDAAGGVRGPRAAGRGPVGPRGAARARRGARAELFGRGMAAAPARRAHGARPPGAARAPVAPRTRCPAPRAPAPLQRGGRGAPDAGCVPPAARVFAKLLRLDRYASEASRRHAQSPAEPGRRSPPDAVPLQNDVPLRPAGTGAAAAPPADAVDSAGVIQDDPPRPSDDVAWGAAGWWQTAVVRERAGDGAHHQAGAEAGWEGVGRAQPAQADRQAKAAGGVGVSPVDRTLSMGALDQSDRTAGEEGRELWAPGPGGGSSASRGEEGALSFQGRAPAHLAGHQGRSSARRELDLNGDWEVGGSEDAGRASSRSRPRTSAAADARGTRGERGTLYGMARHEAGLLSGGARSSMGSDAVPRVIEDWQAEAASAGEAPGAGGQSQEVFAEARLSHLLSQVAHPISGYSMRLWRNCFDHGPCTSRFASFLQPQLLR